ncbi:MAG: ATP-dependent DNA helicase RecQ, partial [Gammaproteobacteria bacterium]
DIATVARQRELTETTVYGHLAQAISAGLLQASEVLDLDKASLLEIESAIESLPEAAENRQMKPVFEALDGAYDYGIIRCVMASICP